LLNGLHVKNFPIRLKLQLSKASGLHVNFILPNPFVTSSAIVSRARNNERKKNTLRPRSREGDTRVARERELHDRERTFLFLAKL